MLNNIIMNLAVQDSRNTPISLIDSLETITEYFKTCITLGYSINKTIIMWIDGVTKHDILMKEVNRDD